MSLIGLTGQPAGRHLQSVECHTTSLQSVIVEVFGGSLCSHVCVYPFTGHLSACLAPLGAPPRINLFSSDDGEDEVTLR